LYILNVLRRIHSDCTTAYHFPFITVYIHKKRTNRTYISTVATIHLYTKSNRNSQRYYAYCHERTTYCRPRNSNLHHYPKERIQLHIYKNSPKKGLFAQHHPQTPAKIDQPNPERNISHHEIWVAKTTYRPPQIPERAMPTITPAPAASQGQPSGPTLSAETTTTTTPPQQEQAPS